jgi:hypothetical protein
MSNIDEDIYIKRCSPVRALLPFAIGLLTLPFIFPVLLTYYAIPFIYFTSSYIFFLNFPSLVASLQKRPLYLDDLILDSEDGDLRDNRFRKAHSLVMNFILAGLFAAFSEYVIIQGIRKKPIMEILGLVGGNLSLYFKIQHMAGKMLLRLCHCLKEQEVTKRKLSDSPRLDLELI